MATPYDGRGIQTFRSGKGGISQRLVLRSSSHRGSADQPDANHRSWSVHTRLFHVDAEVRFRWCSRSVTIRQREVCGTRFTSTATARPIHTSFIWKGWRGDVLRLPGNAGYRTDTPQLEWRHGGRRHPRNNVMLTHPGCRTRTATPFGSNQSF